MSITNLFDWYYWLHQPYIVRGSMMWLWVGMFLAAILAGLVLKFLSQKTDAKYLKKIYNSFSNTGLSVGLVGLLWLFFRQERVAFLAWRFWLLIMAILVIWRVAINVKFLIKRVPTIKKEQADKAAINKYLPNK